MRRSLLLSICATASVAMAQTQEQPITKQITCHFTEPFFLLNIDVDQQITISKTEYDYEQGKITTLTLFEGAKVDVDLSDRFMPVLTVTAPNTDLHLQLRPTGHGTDGMSNTIYPYEASVRFSNSEDPLYGGCDSNLLPAHEDFEPGN